MGPDLSLYSMLKPVEIPDFAESQQRAMTLKQLAMQGDALKAEQQRKAQEYKISDQNRQIAMAEKKNQLMGEAAYNVMSSPVEQRAAAYDSWKKNLGGTGLFSPGEIPDAYDESLVSPIARQYAQSTAGLEKQKTLAEIEKLKSEAKKKSGGLDPMQFFIAKEQYKEQQDRANQLRDQTTEYGIARTADDAKKLKDAGELKSSLDRKLQELIELRTQKGGELLDREAVARANQLSNDVLLAYKDLAKLGVLSEKDTHILNAIIPSDPLQFKVASLVGQDPIMHQLKKFQGDVNADFKTRVKNRVMPSDNLAVTQSAPKEPVVPMIGPDGETRMIPQSMVGEAIAAGGRKAK